MATQLRRQNGAMDDMEKYNADGIIRFEDMADVETLILETSGAYDEGSQRKGNFDSYKAMFGLTSMIKMAAEITPRASFETFSRLKLHFVHAQG